MKFCTTLIAVRDMERSLRFYRNLFGQEVTQDLGWNKTLTCGLTLQEHFDELAGFPAETMKYQPNTMELYFETETFDAWPPTWPPAASTWTMWRRYVPWLQRGVRIFDPDGHLIEVSESMYSVARAQFRQGKTVAETAGLIQHPQHVVEAWYLEYQSESVDKTAEVKCPNPAKQ